MEIIKHKMGPMQVWYLINEKKNVSMLVFPEEEIDKINNPWDAKSDRFDPRARYMHTWKIGGLVYFHTSELNQSHAGSSMKNENVLEEMFFDEQQVEEDKEKKEIITRLSFREYRFIHTLTYRQGLKGIECVTEFINEGQKETYLEMLSSFSLENISPFQIDDAPNKYNFHRFYGGWSMEGKHICTPIEELALEKSWAGFSFNNEKFGSFGSWPVDRYFPTAVVEDKEKGILWSAQLACNSTWQMELSRLGDSLSFTGGLGDKDFCGWRKLIKPGEKFTAPKAFIAAVKGDIYDACASVTDMQKTAYIEYGEKGLPITFNEYCTSWGRPTQEKMLNYCKILKDMGIKYLVIDAGWCKAGCEQDSNGEWLPDKSIFPNIKEMNRMIRANGMIPGIWFEFEVTTDGSKMFESQYDFMHLSIDKKIIKSRDIRSYWDFRREDVRAYLKERVIDFLKENGFGYIKVDYNANIGLGVDGEESAAEELRKHLTAVRDFFVEMKEEIPELIIENCASGGHRLEPSMLGISALSSFSDAHECVEIPYIAANLHNLILPAQSLIWAVLHDDDTKSRTIYTLAAAFLGRICISGEIENLTDEKKELLLQAFEFYRLLENITKNGQTKIYGNRGRNTRYPTGTQAVLRKTDTEAYVICHAFENPYEENIEIELNEKFNIKAVFGEGNAVIADNKLVINKMAPFTALAIYINNK